MSDTTPDVDREEQLRRRARKRVEDVKGFYIHLGIYLIVNTALFVLNMVTNPDHLWFYWPLIGWGIGLAIHGFSLVMEGRVFGPEWEEREVQKLIDKEHAQDASHRS